jgi:hypothetical protein
VAASSRGGKAEGGRETREVERIRERGRGRRRWLGPYPLAQSIDGGEDLLGESMMAGTP